MKLVRRNKKVLSWVMILPMMLMGIGSNSLPIPIPLPPQSSNIKMALLLDTSNSMDGLIEQAKSQLWEIVNELSKATKNGEQANLQIALYEYGNDLLNGDEGYIRNVLPLSEDLDDLSEKLFELKTNGGSEYCGHVIRTATNQLNWETDLSALNMVFIAGNEPFNQGKIDYKESCKNAFDKGITINTIYCGDSQSGINTFWKKGADLTEGNYMNIDMNKKTVYIETPYDDKIASLNDSLNVTYIPFGSTGKMKKSKQIAQDNNSAHYGTSNMVNRAISKSSGMYKNSSWDLVDASKSKTFDFSKVKTEQLPKEMKEMSEEERKAYVYAKRDRRAQINIEIQELNKKRQAYIKEKKSTAGEESFDAAMLAAIKKQAKDKGFEFKEEVLEIIKLEKLAIQPLCGGAHGAMYCDLCAPDRINRLELYKKPYVDYDYFQKLVKEVKPIREKNLLSFEDFVKESKEKGTIILDTRSKEMYDRLHIKGAIHLNFADFTQDRLTKLIPDRNTKILIYCNNNFAQNNEELRLSMVSKAVKPTYHLIEESKAQKKKKINPKPFEPKRETSLALNIPTYINLYGYGYRNIYELDELIEGTNPLLELAGNNAQDARIKDMKRFLVMTDTTKNGLPKALVSYDFFEQLTETVKPHRQKRLVSFAQFNKMAKEQHTIILDTRSKEMYDKLHVKGAIHLNFSMFDQQSLLDLIPDKNTRILIYCNNNFAQDNPFFEESFTSKAYTPPPAPKSNSLLPVNTMALNIPTYINLYGYGYENVYELNELVYSNNKTLELAGTDAKKVKKGLNK